MTLLTATTPPIAGTPNTKSDTQRIDTKSDAYARMEERWQLCRDLMEGTRAIRRNAADYLPQLEGESDAAWEARIKLGALFNGFERTVLASVGMLSVHDPALSEGTPDELQAVWKDVDGAGTHGAVFAAQLRQHALIDGHAGIFVDMPDLGAETVDVATAKARGLRPYWLMVTADDEWLLFYEAMKGKRVLTMLVRRVRKSERDGEFGLKSVTEYWLYTLTGTGVEYAMWRVDDQSAGPVKDARFSSGNGVMRGMSRIPYVRLVANGDPTDIETKPPLQTLADLNIEHHQTKNGILSLEQLAFTPTRVRIGAQPDSATGEYPPMTIGPKSVTEVPYMDGVQKPVYWDSPDVTVIEPAMRTLKETELAMEVMGSAFLASQTRAQETAAAKKINAKAQNATLGRLARAEGDCLTNAMSISAEWLRVAEGVVTTSTEFEDTTLDPQAMTAYVAAVANAGLPPRILLEAWQAGGRISADVDLDELEGEMLANAAAADAQKRIDAELAAAEAANQANGAPPAAA